MEEEDVYDLPSKPLTWVLASVHIAYIVGWMWLGPFWLPQKLRGFWIATMVAQIVHWHVSPGGECVLSLAEKRSEDPDYRAGDDPKLTYAWVILGRATGLSISRLRRLHALITQVAFVYALADQTLVADRVFGFWDVSKNDTNDTRTRTALFVAALIPTLKFVTFDSFDSVAQ